MRASPNIAFLFFVLTGLSSAMMASEPASIAVPRQHLEPFLKEYCVRCHGPEKQKGQIRFDEMAWEITGNDSAQRWQDVLDMLNGGDMPPEDEIQPDKETLSQVLDTLTENLQWARRALNDHGGEIAMRRLNRREYVNTVRDLFGFEISPDLVPEDAGAETFDTVGSEQFFTSTHFDKYYELGKEIVAAGFEWAGQPREDPTTTVKEPEERVTPALRATLADLDNKMRMKNEGKTWQEMGFEDEGEMQIIFSQFDNRAGKPRKYLQYPLVDSGIYMAAVNNETRRIGINRSMDPRASYLFRVLGGIQGSPPELRKFVCVSDDTGPIGVFKMFGTSGNPEMLEIPYRSKMGKSNLSLSIEENRADIRVLDGYLDRLDPGGEWASIWIDRLELVGPFFDEDKSFFEKLLHSETQACGKEEATRDVAQVRRLVERFAFEAFRRRDPAPEFVDQLLHLYQDNRRDGLDFEEALTEVLAVVLASPGFLFLQESGEGRERGRRLDNREFAIRLSYFLWSRPPDDELYARAGDGSLMRPEVLKAQVDRLLNDPRSRQFTQAFSSQWADLDRFDAITVDEMEYFRFNKGIRLSASREVQEFFATLVAENLPAANWIDSDFVVINGVLAEHYEIQGTDTDDFQKVYLPEDSPRGGLLTQTAFLTAGSSGERSSPVIRGALVMEKLLHDKPAPPPPNVPELGSDTGEPLSNRELVQLHQNKAQCASCHKKMDVIGYGLENFDVIGKWRDTEKVGDEERPIVSGGTLPDGRAFSDVISLKQLLMNHQDRLALQLIESMTAYGLGRTIEFSDSYAMSDILQQLQEDDYRVRSMIHAIVASQLFRIK